MAATINRTVARYQDVRGIRKARVLLYTGPASYVTGGDPFTENDVDLSHIEIAPSHLAWNGTAVRLVVWDRVNKKYVWYVPNTGAEVAAAVDLSAFSCVIEVAGY